MEQIMEPLFLSNLQRQDNSNPGQAIDGMKCQAHFRLGILANIGIMMKRGLLNAQKLEFVYVLFIIQIVWPKPKSMTKVHTKNIKDSFNEPNLIIFIMARKININMISDIIQFLFVKYQDSKSPIPSPKPMKSIILSFILPLSQPILINLILVKKTN